jgi:hypothetical protein
MNMRRLPISIKCVMPVASRGVERRLIAVSVLVTAFAAYLLNTDRIVLAEVHLFARVGIPLAILAGIIGAAQRNPRFSKIAIFIFWVSIAFLFAVIVGTIAPRDWFFDPETAPRPDFTALGVRFVIAMSLAALLAVCFHKLRQLKSTITNRAADP